MLMNSLEHELRIESMRLAVSYCKENQNEPLIMTAEKVYQFLTEKDEEKNYKEAYTKFVELLRKEIDQTQV